MKFIASNGNGWVEILSFSDEHGYESFSLESHIDLGHSQFKARNSDLCFLNWPDFSKDLNDFILNRSIQPQLLGTYDSYVKLHSSGNSVYLDFCVGSAYCCTSTLEYSSKGAFEVSQEHFSSAAAEAATYA
ncbi:hypothetical protein [Pseudoalteromonas rhizosphaerae]|uniref:hypothetical protein n=1 Tax=Pseudoalteromonas rhizosphaerae TaxID=2518973 RepID=UPI0037048CE4